MSRVNNSFKNALSSTFGELLSIILKFITRSVFISALGTQFLGINGLFTNILTILSLSELGVGTAITYNLYKPIAEKDNEKIKILMKFYRQTYSAIGILVAILGLLLLPFLPLIIRDDLGIVNVNLIFIIYLMQSVSSYMFFAYKGALIKAQQKEYVINILGYYFSIATSIIQIVTLILIRNFTLYIFIVVLTNILKNLFVAIRVDRLYPYLKEKTEGSLSKDELKQIGENVFAILLYKINTVVLNATDNIVLSMFIGLNIVGLYSNYLLIITTIKAFLSKFYQAIGASVGDLHANDQKEHEYFIFRCLNFFTVYAYGIAAIGTFVTANIFISSWIGNIYTLSQSFVLLISIELYMSGINRLMITYRNSMGLFKQAKYRPVVGSVINLALSLYLVQFMGINGVIIGTIVANLLTYIWYDPYVVMKFGFSKPAFEYYSINIKYALTIIISGVTSYLVSTTFQIQGVRSFVVFGLFSVLISMFFMYLVFGRSPEYKYFVILVNRFWRSFVRKLRANNMGRGE
jgi:O-antigen/teichoic acid export membrane protein